MLSGETAVLVSARSVSVCSVVKQQAAGGATAAGAVDVIDQILCRCQSIQQGVTIILKSFVPAEHVADFSPSQYGFCRALIVFVSCRFH